MDVKKMREEFEAWVRINMPHVPLDRRPQNKDEYDGVYASWTWRTWQVATAATQIDTMAVAEAVTDATVEAAYLTGDVTGPSIAFGPIDLAAIIAAIQPQARPPEPVNQQMLAALKAVNDKFKSRPYGTGSYITKDVRDMVANTIAAAEAAQPVSDSLAWQQAFRLTDQQAIRYMMAGIAASCADRITVDHGGPVYDAAGSVMDSFEPEAVVVSGSSQRYCASTVLDALVEAFQAEHVPDEEPRGFSEAELAFVEGNQPTHCVACGGTGIEVQFGDVDDGDTVEMACQTCAAQHLAGTHPVAVATKPEGTNP